MKLIRLFYFSGLVYMLFFLMGRSFAAKMDEVDMEFLIAGVKYNGILVKSSKIHFTIQSTHNKEFLARIFGVQFEDELKNIFFAHDGRKVRWETRSSIGLHYIAIFDGEKQVEIDKSDTPRLISVRGALTIDQRSHLISWYLHFWEQPLGDYLEKYATTIVGTEYVNNTLCYIIEAAELRGEEKVKFWVAPSRGFQVLKKEEKIAYQDGIPTTVITVIQYQKVGEGWFPKSGTETFFMLNRGIGKQELSVKHTLTVKDVELNIDVSDLFKLDIPPNTEVWDHRTQSKRTAKEAGISP